MDDETNAMLEQSALDMGGTLQANVDRATQEIRSLMDASGESILEICTEAESATTKEHLRESFRRFTRIVRILLEAVPEPEFDRQVRDALIAFKVSSRLSGFLSSAGNVSDAITLWKKNVIRDLAVDIRRREDLARRYDSIDDALFADAFTEAASDSHQGEIAGAPIRKRGVSALEAPPRTAKRSKIPALSSIDRVAEALAGVSSKRALVTREKSRFT